jgi:hypothetical protein
VGSTNLIVDFQNIGIEKDERMMEEYKITLFNQPAIVLF